MLTDKAIERLIEVARSALLRNHPQAAIEPLRSALTYDPDNALAHALLADALRQLRRLEAAMAEAHAAIACEPEMPYAHVVLGYIHFTRREPALARRHFETARELGPMDSSPLIGLAVVAQFEDKDEEARRLFEGALELDPEDMDAIVGLGNLHLARGKHREAETFARQALDIEPENLEALVLMGHLHLARGELEQARDHAIWALRSNATDVDAIGLLAAIKARESLTLGLWYRANTALMRLGPKAMLILLGCFVFQKFVTLALNDLGYPNIASVVYYGWLAVCIYSWVGPQRFRAMIDKELEAVQLRSDY